MVILMLRVCLVVERKMDFNFENHFKDEFMLRSRPIFNFEVLLMVKKINIKTKRKRIGMIWLPLD